MMVRILAATCLLGLPLTVAEAASTQKVWQGEAFATAVTDACATNATVEVADFFRIIYRPKLASTDPAEGLSFVGSRSTYLAISQAGSAMFQGSGSYKGTYISSRAATGSTTGASSLSISPLPITSGTGTITISGTLTNFFAATGCDVTFRAALTPRP